MNQIRASDVEVGNIYFYYEMYDDTKYVSAIKVLQKNTNELHLQDVTQCVEFKTYDGKGFVKVQEVLEEFEVNICYDYGGCITEGEHYYTIYELTEEELQNNVLLEMI